ncbi:MAG: amidohydrolase family protein, partial [Candidatus Hydrogenedentales bacterium]
MQATHATSDMPWAEERVGAERIRGAYAWRKFLDAGCRIANGSDFPVEHANPLWGFYASVTRQDHAGKPAGGWWPEERMTRAEALRSITIDAAYAAFQEEVMGSLEVGKLADFVVLSHDIMTIAPHAILETQVLRTVVNGQT